MAHWRQCHEADAARRVVVVDFVVVAEYLCLGAAFGRHAGNGCAAAAGSLEGRDELPQQAARMEPEEEVPRKRTSSNVLSIFIWLAYVSADSLAIFVLGHLALHINGLVLFWAPFMLLHLGGQETITAFSMEDNMLWKRHLLTLATQVGLAAYVVGKQWQGDKQLLAPMVLIFISGTIKYACRTSALMFTAEQTTPGSNLGMQAKGCIVKLVHPESKPQWSQKLAQYNLIIGCIKQKRAAAGSCLLKCMKRVIGIQPSTMTHVDISHELKKLVLDKLLQVGSRLHPDDVWDISKFTGQWAKLELMRSKLHIESSSRARLQHGILSGNDGHMRLRNAQEFIVECLQDRQEALDQDAVVRSVAAKIDNLTEDFEHPRILTAVEPVLIQSGQLAKELLKMKEANDRWDIIMNVWMEMLCYMAFHCGPGFHNKQFVKVENNCIGSR
ncbi:hypothetical protein OsI_27758 [Oryza sativa Indica Group]|uniref:DUF4220 domain-containing protein n=1 Tax=Oryza sativa subsp. indica TaxID=39946 RepID=B8BAM4_ORYSI|nr:hypothetical protein OsI_27758 [Oryza sativa Indica Group]